MTGTVGYLTKRFPRLSETFILDEILGLESLGVPLRLYAINHPHEPTVQPDVARVRSRVAYLHGIAGRRDSLRSAGATAAAHLRLLSRRPGRYLNALARLVAVHHDLPSVRHFVEAGRLAVLLERDGARHLHAAFAHGPASVAYFVRLLTGLPYSFSGHAKDLYLSRPDRLARRVADAEFVLVCSGAAADDLRAIAGPAADRVRLAYHGVDTARFRPVPDGAPRSAEVGPAGTPLRLLAVGRLVDKKGYPVLLDALARVTASGRRVSCRVIGAGPQSAALKARARDLGLEDSIEFLGARTQLEVAAAYHWADAFVQASVVLADGDRDGVPNSVLEAMASGLPVVASTVSGIPEAVVDGVTGLLVPPADVAALAEGLTRLIDDPALRARLARGARDHVVDRFDRMAAIRAIAPLFSPGAAVPVPAMEG
ncbi:MAG TPA: glycosyltransferase [Thermomicrobiaceae bacterium]|nr:glycosyltransferase [Thermomicrobiaceae bacterium]